jgi:hypothetical protein
MLLSTAHNRDACPPSATSSSPCIGAVASLKTRNSFDPRRFSNPHAVTGPDSLDRQTRQSSFALAMEQATGPKAQNGRRSPDQSVYVYVDRLRPLRPNALTPHPRTAQYNTRHKQLQGCGPSMPPHSCVNPPFPHSLPITMDDHGNPSLQCGETVPNPKGIPHPRGWPSSGQRTRNAGQYPSAQQAKSLPMLRLRAAAA